MDPEDERRLLRNQQDQAIHTARMQEQLASLSRDFAKQAEDHYQFVMHPEEGCVVRGRRLRDSVDALAREVAANGAEARKVAGLERELKAVQDARAAEAAERKERARDWRDWIVPTALAGIVALLVGLMDRWLSG